MIILHIAYISNNFCNGVCVAAPKHISAQSAYATVGLINVNQVKIDGVATQIEYDDKFDVNKLPEPFNKPDVVVFHEVYRVQYLSISRNLRRNKIPYVIIPHGELQQEAQQKKWLKKKVANILLFNRFIYGAVAVQCLSQNEIDKTLFGKRKFIGTNGINMPSKEKLKFNSHGLKLVFIGRLDVHHKGLDLLMQAVSQIKDFLIDNDCHFHIYGPDFVGRYAQVEELICVNDVGQVVELSHEVCGEEKERILLDSDIFIQTSRYEGMPMGILEPLSYGIPCIVTQGTTLGKIIEQYDAGWACETTAEDIARAIKQAVQEKDKLATKSQGAISLIRDNFLWSEIARQTIDKYKDLVSGEIK